MFLYWSFPIHVKRLMCLHVIQLSLPDHGRALRNAALRNDEAEVSGLLLGR